MAAFCSKHASDALHLKNRFLKKINKNNQLLIFLVSLTLGGYTEHPNKISFILNSYRFHLLQYNFAVMKSFKMQLRVSQTSPRKCSYCFSNIRINNLTHGSFNNLVKQLWVIILNSILFFPLVFSPWFSPYCSGG